MEKISTVVVDDGCRKDFRTTNNLMFVCKEEVFARCPLNPNADNKIEFIVKARRSKPNDVKVQLVDRFSQQGIVDDRKNSQYIYWGLCKAIIRNHDKKRYKNPTAFINIHKIS